MLETIAATLQDRLQSALTPTHLGVEDESHMHSGPHSETHFRVVVVADSFSDLSLVARHQAVYAAVGDLMKNPIHALAIQALTPEEWLQKGGDLPGSPLCRGGSK